MSKIPLAGRGLPLLLLLASPLVLPGCGDGEGGPEVEVPEDPAEIDNPDLLGYWAVVERNGEVLPQDQQVRYQFTAQGDFLRYEGAVLQQARYTFASADQITIDGPDGTRFYDYEIDGDELTLSEPGEDGDALRLIKVADQDIEDVPPPGVNVPAEDSLPIDSMAATADTLA